MENVHLFLGEAVRARRERLGISQEAFAVTAGVHRTYMSSIERGKVQISVRVAAKIAVALGVPLSALIRHAERLAAKKSR